jgi:hypothetical protein
VNVWPTRRPTTLSRSELNSLRLVTASSLVLGLLTIVVALWTQHKQAQVAFELKAAEIVMAHRNPGAIRYRSRVLRTLFPRRLPSTFGEAFDPKEFFGPNFENKLEIFKAMAANPD